MPTSGCKCAKQTRNPTSLCNSETHLQHPRIYRTAADSWLPNLGKTKLNVQPFLPLSHNVGDIQSTQLSIIVYTAIHVWSTVECRPIFARYFRLGWVGKTELLELLKQYILQDGRFSITKPLTGTSWKRNCKLKSICKIKSPAF